MDFLKTVLAIIQLLSWGVEAKWLVQNNLVNSWQIWTRRAPLCSQCFGLPAKPAELGPENWHAVQNVITFTPNTGGGCLCLVIFRNIQLQLFWFLSMLMTLGFRIRWDVIWPIDLCKERKRKKGSLMKTHSEFLRRWHLTNQKGKRCMEGVVRGQPAQRLTEDPRPMREPTRPGQPLNPQHQWLCAMHHQG